MKNKVILAMACEQYGWKAEDVQVEFISYIEGEYEFKVTHHTDVAERLNFKVKTLEWDEDE